MTPKQRKKSSKIDQKIAAKNDQKIYDYNYQAVKESIDRAIKGTPTAKEVVSQKASAEHPFGNVKV